MEDQVHRNGDGSAAPQARRPFARRWARRLLWLMVLAAGLPVLQVLVLRFVDPPLSTFMAIRQIEAWTGNERDFTLHYAWRDFDRIASSLPVSVIAAEDQNFAGHRGFDLEAIEKARAHNARGGRTRGASTISQQTAKNLFLWSGRSWVRKGLEAWYTVLIEVLWPKTRILEVYLNIAEFGDGVYGAQSAATRHFGKDASALSAAESARLAAVLPSPRRYNASRPGPYVQRRAQWVQRNARQLGGEAYLESLK